MVSAVLVVVAALLAAATLAGLVAGTPWLGVAVLLLAIGVLIGPALPARR